MVWRDYIPEDIQGLYEIRDYHHAAAILANEFKSEFENICETLREFRITTQDIIDPGGNESRIPKKVSEFLKSRKWTEQQLQAEMVIDQKSVRTDTHKIDHVKGRVAFDVEWNSKDQTFDRDLYAFRTFFEFNRISVGVILTRSNDLDVVFEKLGTFTDPKDGKEKPVKAKYGASTTHVGQLWRRLDAGREGGCPVLVFGMTPAVISDWKDHPKNVESASGSTKPSRRKYIRHDLG